MKNPTLLLLLIALFSCESQPDSEAVIDQAIQTAGGENLNNTDIEFIFRNIEYGAKHQDGLYEYVRLFKDSIGLVRDELTNDGFVREIDGKVVNIPDTMAAKYTNSVNSVIYFALLPIGLDAPAVNTAYLDEKEIGGQTYHKVKVTFDKKGGGEDHEDVFIYWVNQKTNKVDYLGYSYETDGGGMRFREAMNERYVGGIRFVDYVNYKPQSSIDLIDFDDAFINGNLEEVSRIELENIKVNELD